MGDKMQPYNKAISITSMGGNIPGPDRPAQYQLGKLGTPSEEQISSVWGDFTSRDTLPNSSNMEIQGNESVKSIAGVNEIYPPSDARSDDELKRVASLDRGAPVVFEGEKYVEYSLDDNPSYMVNGLLIGGSSGLGEVWLGKRLVNNEDVALKIFDPDANHNPDIANYSCSRETKIAKSIPTHPNVIQVYEKTFIRNPRYNPNIKGKSAEPFLPVLVMEYVEGQTLERLSPAQLDNRIRMMILEDSAKGLDHIHSNGVIHRDIKPSQFLIPMRNTPDWEKQYLESVKRPNVKMIDFGQSINTKHGQTEVSFEKIHTLSVGYASPRVYSGESAEVVDDLWSFAATAFYSFSGEPPYSSHAFIPGVTPLRFIESNLKKIKSENTKIAPEHAEELNKFFYSLLQEDGLRTFNSATKIVDEIKRITSTPIKSKGFQGFKKLFGVS